MSYVLPKDRPGFEPIKEKRPAKKQESKMQQACVLWFDYQHSHISKLLWAIPNGGKRNKAEAAIMKGEGVRAGVPDLFLGVARGVFHGLFIEMKEPGKEQSDVQKEYFIRLRGQGYACEVCYSKEQFMEIVNTYLALK